MNMSTHKTHDGFWLYFDGFWARSLKLCDNIELYLCDLVSVTWFDLQSHGGGGGGGGNEDCVFL